MIVPSPYPATLDDLAKVSDKAELVAGRIIHLMPTGRLPSRVAKRIFVSLNEYERRTGVGEAFPDNIGYAIRPPLADGRESFAPDASYYIGPSPEDSMGFIDGPPTFAVEVRSENDYGPAADRAYAEKRADYFAAGTRAVWDVDPVGETVACYRAADPLAPTVFRRGDTADAEPAVPGWRLSVDDLFGPRPAAAN